MSYHEEDLDYHVNYNLYSYSLLFQLYSNMPNLAQQTLDSCRHECRSNGMLMEQSRIQVIEANCILGRSNNLSEKGKTESATYDTLAKVNQLSWLY